MRRIASRRIFVVSESARRRSEVCVRMVRPAWDPRRARRGRERGAAIALPSPLRTRLWASLALSSTSVSFALTSFVGCPFVRGSSRLCARPL